MDTTVETYTNDLWTLYFHDPDDSNWSIENYHRLTEINSIESFWRVHLKIKERIHCGMFFLMREHVFPCWDDPNNIKGGCLSIKVLKQDMKEFWEKLSIALVGETILQKEKIDLWNVVNGISTSPKKHFCIIKIWLSNDMLNSKIFFNLPSNYYGEILYKSNTENIENNNVITNSLLQAQVQA